MNAVSAAINREKAYRDTGAQTVKDLKDLVRRIRGKFASPNRQELLAELGYIIAQHESALKIADAQEMP